MATVPALAADAIRKAGRRSRYRAHHALRERSIRHGAKSCMCAIVGQGVEVSAHQSGRVTVAGVQRCGSMAACPICAETGRRTRAGEIDAIARVLLDLPWTSPNGKTSGRGHHLFFVTATASHQRPFPLRIMQRAIGESWGTAWSGKAMGDGDMLGQIKAWDYTYGEHGWHPHIHGLVVVAGWVPLVLAESFVHQRFAVYKRALERRNQTVRKNVRNKVTGQIDSVGWDVKHVDSVNGIDAYVAGIGKVTKVFDHWSIGLELAAAQAKRRSVSPWAILRAAVDGEVPPGTVLQGMTVDDLWSLWREYETATKGIKQIIIGRELGKLARVEIATERAAVEGADDTAVVYVERFTASEWQAIVTSGRVHLVLEDVERRGAALMRAGP